MLMLKHFIYNLKWLPRIYKISAKLSINPYCYLPFIINSRESGCFCSHFRECEFMIKNLLIHNKLVSRRKIELMLLYTI